MGFGIPIKEWLLGDLQPMMEDLLLSERFRERSFFNTTYVEKLIKDNPKVNHTERLWTLMCLEKWFRICHDPNVSK
jgi:asparagine synthase (glutamine-hydrolysing)